MGIFLSIFITFYDSLNVRFVSNWPFGASYAVACDMGRKLIFGGSGGGVYILDFTDPANPQKISEGIHTRGIIFGLFYDTLYQRLYIVSEDGGMEIWDVSEPSSPFRFSRINLYSQLWEIYVSGNYAYIASEKLKIVDVSDPRNPFLVGEYQGDAPFGGVFAKGNYVYLTDIYSEFSIIDVSDPSNPQRVARINFSGVFNLRSLYVSGDYAYVVGEDALVVVDITDPQNPFEVGRWQSPVTVRSVYVIEPYAYLAVSTRGLYIIDISDPQNPVSIGNYDTDGNAYWVCGDTTYAFLAVETSKIYIINVEDPYNPFEESQFYTPDREVRSVCIFDNYVYIAQGRSSMGYGFQIVDISDVGKPQEIGFFSGNYKFVDIEVMNNYLYAAVGDSGLRIIDITDPQSPSEIGSYRTPNYANSICVLNNYAYVTESNFGLRIIDVSDPQSPYEVGSCEIGIYVSDVYVADNYAYVVERDSGLIIIDVSDPYNPLKVGFYDTPGYAHSVYVLNNYAYIADGDFGIRIIDVANPQSPYEVGFYDTPGSAKDLFVIDNFVYVADGSKGVRIIDVSDPQNPFESGFYSYSRGLLTPCGRIAGWDRYIIAGHSEIGLQIYQNLLLSVGEGNPMRVIFSTDFLKDKEFGVFDITGRRREFINKRGVYFYKIRENGKIFIKILKF